MRTFADTIRDSRIAEGLTVRELEKKIQSETGVGISDTSISFFENQIRAPTYETGIVIAESLGIGKHEAVMMTFLARLEWFLQKEKKAMKELETQQFNVSQIANDIDSIRTMFYEQLDTQSQTRT